MITTFPIDLAVALGKLRLPNPIALASGTCGYGAELAAFQDLAVLGGLFTKGLTLEARGGNAPARLAETPSGMINRIGLQNVGVEAFLSDKLPFLARRGVPVIANVAGQTADEYAELASRLDGAPGLVGLELNVSCPNVDQGGIAFGTDARALERVVAKVRQRSRLPLIVKLTPAVTDLGELARAAEAGGADALAAINTMPALAVAPRLTNGKLTAALVQGGLSGPALKPIALRCVREARKATNLPVIGVGGVGGLPDVLEFLAAGASAVQVGTASFIDPGLAGRLVAELSEWLAASGVQRLADILPEREEL